jgi:serine/threonine protein kinase
MAVPAESHDGRQPVKVVGRYALYGEIAAGGMATVHIGRLLGPVGFARTVAIKRLHPQFAKDPEFVSMFLDEARLAARVQHPNVVATIDVVATDGELFLIMDYVRGESLSKLVRSTVKRDEWVAPRIVAGIMCGFLHGLHAAHEAKNERGEPLNLIHRDVSPQNVLVGSDGVARVLDFGVAKAAGRIQVTREGQVKGKLAYMPPEQLSGSPTLSRQVDLYASAVVFWEAITGERLFKGESEGETLHKILRGVVEAPSSRVQGLNPMFDEVCLKALSRDPALRYKTAREMALALEHCEGIASPTEVGEWVERVAGTTLSDREDKIAEIESGSAGMHMSPSGRMQARVPLAPTSDSDVSKPIPPSGFSAPRIEATLVGVGPGSQGSLPVLQAAPSEGGVPSSRRERRDRRASLSDSEVFPNGRRRGSGLTGLTRLMTLPMEKRLPYLVAGGAGLMLLLILIIGLVVAKRSDAATNAPSPSASSASNGSASSSASSVASAALVAPPDSASVALADPKPDPTSIITAPSATPPVTSPPPPPPVTVRQPPWHPPVTAQPPPPLPPVKKNVNCDPPFTIDSKGHKHYKVECN